MKTLLADMFRMAREYDRQQADRARLEALVTRAGFDPNKVLVPRKPEWGSPAWEQAQIEYRYREDNPYIPSDTVAQRPPVTQQRTMQKETSAMPTSVRSSVVVDGISLTRQQIEQALEALNKPVEPTPEERIAALEPGDHITFIRMYSGPCTYIITSAPRLYVNVETGLKWTATEEEVALHLRNGRLTIQRKAGRS